MLSNIERTENKSKGPWGMKNFNFTYRHLGEAVQRHRFVNAPSRKGAQKQFLALMDRDGHIVEILSIDQKD